MLFLRKHPATTEIYTLSLHDALPICSSRDWAAKGTLLLGVRAVLAESYERIHRSNLVGMGVMPLEFLPGESAATHGLTGRESCDVEGLADGLAALSPGRNSSGMTDRK